MSLKVFKYDENGKKIKENHVDRVTALYRRNHLETLKTLIQNGVINKYDTVENAVKQLEKSWNLA